MADKRTINVPDIGGAEAVDVIEIMVKVGDTIDKDDSIITLESEKASMEIPASESGTVSNILIKVGDTVKEGSAILELESVQSNPSEDSKDEEKAADKQENAASNDQRPDNSSNIVEVHIPDIGGAQEVDVIDVCVCEGDIVEKEQALITLETDKATMDIPSPHNGKIIKKEVAVGHKVSEGTLIFTMEVDKHSQADNSSNTAEKSTKNTDDKYQKPQDSSKETINKPSQLSTQESHADNHAGPAVRRIAHELGVDLSLVNGSGRKNRITKEDVAKFVKTKLASSGTGGIVIEEVPSIDFSKFGETKVKALNKIKRLTGKNMHRSWVTIPHVTQFDETDITELEAFRKKEQTQAQKSGYKLTVLAFVVKAVYQALRAFPQFNASLDNSGENLILKNYYNIGIAVDTPNGLVVPVIKDVNHCNVADIAREMSRLSTKAREKGLMPADMSGGCFTISSLGGVGGTAFTPIVNSPEVAILGLSRASIKPIYNNNNFEPRLMLPMSLSYDHRVIDGVEAARFTQYLGALLADVRRLVLGN